MSMAFGDELAPLVNYRLKFVENRAVYEQDILEELKQDAPLPNVRELQDFIARIGVVSPAFTETLSFRLFKKGANAEAWSVLMARYPFATMAPDQRDVLLERLALIADRDPTVVTRHDRGRLSEPLSSLRARSIQAGLLAMVGECSGVRRVLGDFSDGYGVSQWMLLGGCYQKAGLSGLAQMAYQQAAVAAPSALTERAVAFAAFTDQDFQTALKAWRRSFEYAAPSPSDLVAAATTALAAQDSEQARLWLDQYESLNTKSTADYWTLRAQAWASVDLNLALVDMQRAIALDPTAERLLELGRWQLTLGDQTGALASIQKAVKLAPKDGLAQSELGFLFYQLGQLKPAREHLSEAMKSRPGDPQIIQQLAYIDQQLGDNTQSMAFIRLAVDHDLRFLPQEQTPERVESLFALRRMYEDLDRRWTFSVDALSGSAPSLSAGSPQPGLGYRSYSQIEVDYRLGNPAVNNGKTLSVYSRVFGGSGVDNSTVPVYAPMLGVGLRWKPLAEQVLYLSIEKQIPLDHGTSAPSNTMLRASASLFNDGIYSDD
jgi:adsorption protein A